jgi:putative ABC transport system ATP-binding protein
MITIKNLSKHFQIEDETLHIFKDLSINIKKGSTNAIIGPSGSGKSTFLNLLA